MRDGVHRTECVVDHCRAGARQQRILELDQRLKQLHDRVVVILPNTGSADALTVADVVKRAVAAACLPVGSLPELTFGMGVACFPEDGQETTVLLNAADEATNRARKLGKNQVATASNITPSKAKPAEGVLVDG